MPGARATSRRAKRSRLSVGIARTRGDDAGTRGSCSPSVRIHCANILGTQEPLIQVEMGGGDDYALPNHHWPAAASDVWHSLYQLHACAARPMSLLPLRAEPTIRIQIPRREQRQMQHLCGPFSARTQQSKKAVATGEIRCGKNSRS